MTLENRILLGLDDLLAVTFVCNTCTTRVTIAANRLHEVPVQCPECRHAWGLGNPAAYDAVASPYMNFISAIVKIRAQLENGATPFRILLEFDAP